MYANNIDKLIIILFLQITTNNIDANNHLIPNSKHNLANGTTLWSWSRPFWAFAWQHFHIVLDFVVLHLLDAFSAFVAHLVILQIALPTNSVNTFVTLLESQFAMPHLKMFALILASFVGTYERLSLARSIVNSRWTLCIVCSDLPSTT